MGYKTLGHPENTFSRDYWELFDDFTWYVDAHQWTKVTVGTGTLTHEGDAGRTCVKLFATADKDAAVLATTDEIGKYTANKAIIAECRVIFTDVDTDDGALFFGLADVVDGSQVADATGAITATDAIGIYKLMDTSVWAFHTEINGSVTGIGTATTGSTSTTTAGGSSFQTLRWELLPRTSTVFEARPYVDGVQLRTSANVPIMHTVTLGTATEQHFQFAIKSPDAADFSVFVDYMYLAVMR